MKRLRVDEALVADPIGTLRPLLEEHGLQDDADFEQL